jgi:hypothetical protein
MRTIEEASSRELEIAQVKLAIAKTDRDIERTEIVLRNMRVKQLRRHCEVARQEVWMKMMTSSTP